MILLGVLFGGIVLLFSDWVSRLGFPFSGCSVRHCTLSDKQLEKRLAA
jgi:hypothetical protein